MAWSVRAIAIALGFALQAGCFSDPPPIGGAGTTGGGCPIGSLGCPCTDGNGCDVGLECLLSAGVCIDVDCTPGDGLCSCGGGMACADGFVCVDDYCEPVSTGTTAGSDPTLPTDPSMPVETLATGGFTSDFTGTVGPPMTGGPGGTGATSQGTGGVPLTCEECMGSARTGVCAIHWPCADCDVLYECFSQDLSPMCCADQPGIPVGWNDFASCVDIVCEGLCPLTYCMPDGDISST